MEPFCCLVGVKVFLRHSARFQGWWVREQSGGYMELPLKFEEWAMGENRMFE